MAAKLTSKYTRLEDNMQEDRRLGCIVVVVTGLVFWAVVVAALIAWRNGRPDCAWAVLALCALAALVCAVGVER
jgi:hypothetical protein